MTSRSKALAVALTLLVSLPAPTSTLIGPSAGARADDLATAAFRAINPARLLDTRDGDAEPLAPGTTLTVPVGGRNGVPADASAVAVTLAVTESAGPGFITLWGDGPRPLTSALNVDAAHQTRSNSAIVPLSSNGDLNVFTLSGAHVVIDVAGAFIPASSSSPGRLVTVTQTRAVDTRHFDEPFAPSEQRTISLSAAGVPAEAAAAVISLTGLGAEGFWSAFPAGTAWPGTSSVSVPAGGAPATATAIVPLTAGLVTLLSSAGGHLIIDVIGYFTGPSAPSASSGLFVAVAPTRAADTRTGLGGTSRLSSGSTAEIWSVPFWLDDAVAVAMNVTAVDVTMPGFLTVHPSGTGRPLVASANVSPGQVLAVGTLSATSSEGLSVFSSASLDLVVDVTGYFTASPPTVPASPGAPNVASAPAGAKSKTPTAPPASSDFTFLYQHEGGRHAQFDPCAHVTVRVNYTNAPSGAREAVVDAVRQLKLSTGLKLTVGVDTAARSLSVTPHAPTIVVRWSSTSEQPSFANKGLIGLGGGIWTVLGDGNARVLAGTVEMNPKVFLDGAGLRSAMLHELAHAVGLGHAGWMTEVMYPKLIGHREYQLGDRNGLYQLGSTAPCASFGPVPSASTSSCTQCDADVIPHRKTGPEALGSTSYVETIIEN